MQHVMFKWGAIAGLIIFGVPLMSYFILGGGTETYQVGEIIGYATIVVSLLMVFAAIHEYRKMQDDQRVSFGKGLLIGLGISAFAGTLFGIYNWVYVTYLEPDFMDQYYNYYIEQLRASGRPQAEIAAQIQNYEAEKEFFQGPIVQFATMFGTVFIIGIVVSVFSAAVQSKINPS